MGIRIPRGKQYKFTVIVKDNQTFLPKDLTGSTSVLNILDKATNSLMFSVTMSYANAEAALNGVLNCTIDANKTILLSVMRGDKEDGYYLKAGYIGTIDITYASGTSPDIHVFIDKVYVTPTGL